MAQLLLYILCLSWFLKWLFVDLFTFNFQCFLFIIVPILLVYSGS
ncbi:hypothetical protein PFLA_b1121 [Pseudoalteromonas flavipulchra NCIMB 2033 = ATCC BAA-314]|nr:hypothetical protein [Pseudoalteromonas flavipulchra NCIMB 2033 = ATCC BAA-314]